MTNHSFLYRSRDCTNTPTYTYESSLTLRGAKSGADPIVLGSFRYAWHGPFITNATPDALRSTHRKRQNSQLSIKTP